jgi:hypothetical protein
MQQFDVQASQKNMYTCAAPPLRVLMENITMALEIDGGPAHLAL